MNEETSIRGPSRGSHSLACDCTRGHMGPRLGLLQDQVAADKGTRALGTGHRVCPPVGAGGDNTPGSAQHLTGGGPERWGRGGAGRGQTLPGVRSLQGPTQVWIASLRTGIRANGRGGHTLLRAR